MKFLNKFILLLIAGSISLLFTEMILRKLNIPATDYAPFVRVRTTGYKMVESLNQRMATSEYDVPFKTNSLGLRDSEVPPKKGFRTLFIGDSFTVGVGVPAEDSFFGLLKKQLEGEAVNGATIGHDTIHHLYYFKNAGKELQADLVVYIMFLSNDLIGNNKWEYISGELVSKDLRFPVFTLCEYKVLNLVRLFVNNIKIKTRSRREWRPFAEHLALCRKQPNALAVSHYSLSEKLVAELNHEVAATGARFLVILFSDGTVIESDTQQRYKATFHNFDGLYDLRRPERIVSEFLDRQNIAYVNVNDALIQSYERNKIPLYYKYDGHFNKEGHQVMAQILFPIISREIDLKNKHSEIGQ